MLYGLSARLSLRVALQADACGCSGGTGWSQSNGECTYAGITSQDEADICSNPSSDTSCARFTSCGACIAGTGSCTFSDSCECDWCSTTNRCDSQRCYTGRYVLHGGSCSNPETASDSAADAADSIGGVMADAASTIGGGASSMCDDNPDSCSGACIVVALGTVHVVHSDSTRGNAHAHLPNNLPCVRGMFIYFCTSTFLEPGMGTTTDCSVKAWAPNLQSLAAAAANPLALLSNLPTKLSSDIYDEDPWVETPSCKDGVGSKYDSVLSQPTRELLACGLSMAGTDVCVPSGDQICHAICSLGCGKQYMDPSGYVLAAEVECSSPVVVIRKSLRPQCYVAHRLPPNQRCHDCCVE